MSYTGREGGEHHHPHPHPHHPQADVAAEAWPCPPNPKWSDIQGCFTPTDVACMKQESQTWPQQLDLTSYQSVLFYKDAINGAVNSGQMPADPSEQPWKCLACWNTWYANGCPE